MTIEKQYCIADLRNEQKRNLIISELQEKTFEMQVIRNTKNNFMFFDSPDFEDHVFVLGSVFADRKPQIGEIWNVKVCVVFYYSQNQYGFTVKSGSYLRKEESVVSADIQKTTANQQKSVNIANPVNPVNTVNTTRAVKNVNAIPSVDKKIILQKFIAEIQQIHSVKTESDFLKKCPQQFGFTYAFVKKHKTELNQIISILQSICTKRDMKQQVYEEKIEALSHIFKSHAEYAQLAKTLNLSSSQKIQISQSPQKVHPQQAVATKRTPIKGTVSGINYNPEVDYKTEYNALSGITTFSKNATHIRIYIDET